MTNLEQSHQIRHLIKDLSEKYPRGPMRRLNSRDYRKTELWSDAYKKYVPGVALSQSLLDRATNSLGITQRNIHFFGYDPLDLYKICEKWSNEGDVKAYIRTLMPECVGSKLTRRARLLWVRMRPAVIFIKREGTEGIWRAWSNEALDLTSMWRDAYLYGVNKADVESQVRLIGPMTGFKPEWSLSITFDRLGTRDEAMQKLTHILTHRVNSIKLRLDYARKELAGLEREYEQANSIMICNMGGAMLLSNDEEQEVTE